MQLSKKDENAKSAMRGRAGENRVPREGDPGEDGHRAAGMSILQLRGGGGDVRDASPSVGGGVGWESFNKTETGTIRPCPPRHK